MTGAQSDVDDIGLGRVAFRWRRRGPGKESGGQAFEATISTFDVKTLSLQNTETLVKLLFMKQSQRDYKEYRFIG